MKGPSGSRVLIAMAGMPGTGKSTIAHQLEKRLGGIVLSKDRIRSQLFPPEKISYSREQDDLCMDVLFEIAHYVFTADLSRIVIIDGRTFSRTYQVEQLLSRAEDLQAKPVIIECVCDAEIVRQRLEDDRNARTHIAGNRTWQLYLDLKEKSQPITGEHLEIDTGKQSLRGCVDLCFAYLRKSFGNRFDDLQPEKV